MKKIILSLIISLFTVKALGQAKSDLDVLRTGYEKAVKKAVDPIDQIYIKNLKLLLEKQAKAGNTTQITLINQELEKLSAKSVNSGANLKSFVNNKTWNCFNHKFKFNEDGTGEKLHGTGNIPFSWRKLNDTTVEVVGRDTLNSVPKTWIFVFDSENREFYLTDGQDKTKKVITLE